MLHRFQTYLHKQISFQRDERILAAVSGGIDSIVLCHLLHKSGIDFGIAHMNFGLRGNESDQDELFVKKLAETWNVPFYSKKVDTNDFVKVHQVSIQMAARELRYLWFQEIAGENNFRYIATAHHQNDVVETILLNLTRGTGLAGLHGITPVQKNLIRPLLFATREEIEMYAKKYSFEWREDSSNQSDDYARNLIRHKVIPALKELNPSLEKTMMANIEKFSGAEKVLQEKIKNIQSSIRKTDNGWWIAKELFEEKETTFLLYELVREYGFTYDDVKNITEDYIASGKKIISGNYILYNDRYHYILSPSQNNVDEKYTEACGSFYLMNQEFELDVSPRHDAFKIPGDSNIACLDADEITFPLHFRKWQEGDRFCPLGMKQQKKVSDFLIDEKIPVPEKNQTLVVLSGKEIIWLVGLRIDHRYRITEKTRNILTIKRQVG